MTIKGEKRQAVYDKYSGHCAYCGKQIKYEDMQVDHITPQRKYADKKIADRFENLNPSCRRCNHYKRSHDLEHFRGLLITLHKRIRKQYLNKVAEDYGIVEVKEWDGKFYFERGGGA